MDALPYVDDVSADARAAIDALIDAETRGRNERRKLAVEYRLRKKALLQHFIEG